jgi:hypothetical protein
VLLDNVVEGEHFVGKNKFSQPALPGMPRPRDLMTPEARYPRGYTPERQRAISDAFKNTHVGGTINPDNPDPSFPKDIRKLRALAIDSVANSKIQPEQLQGIHSINFNEGDEKNTNMDENEMGNYRGGIINIRGSMTGVERNEGASNLRHEIGHHATLGTVPPNGTDTNRGLREGVADEFAQTTENKIHRGAPSRLPNQRTYVRRALRGTSFGGEHKDWSEGYFQGRAPGRREEFIKSLKPGDYSDKFADANNLGVQLALPGME